MKKNILILMEDDESFFAKKMQEYGNEVQPLYLFKYGKLAFLRRMWFKFNLPLESMWYNSKLKNCQHNEIIVFDAVSRVKFIKWLKRYNFNKKIIFWYWNPVNIRNKFYKLNTCEIWSYSLKDCIKYNLIYNNQFYFKNIHINVSHEKQDILFVGCDKGRMEALLKYKEEFLELEISIHMHITPTRWWQLYFNHNYKKPISYNEILNLLSESKAILDIYNDIYAGLSLRVMESIYFSKKLITNNVSIQNYDFYNKENIFILGKNNIFELKLFIESPWQKIDDTILKNYDFSNWINNFNL